MGKRSRLQVLAKPLPAFVRANGGEALRQRPDRTSPAQGQCSGAIQQRLNRTAKLRPEFNLAGDGAIRDLRSQSRVEYQFVGKLDWLTHKSMVAKCYRVSKRGNVVRRQVSGLVIEAAASADRPTFPPNGGELAGSLAGSKGVPAKPLR